MASKRKKKDTKKLLKMAWNEEIPVLDEDSKFFICKGQQFRKSNPNILEVVEETVEEIDEMPVPDKDEEERSEK